MAALLASKMPVEEASALLEHLTGIQLPRATLDREAKRQGERAQALRTQLDRQAATQKRQLELSLEPYQMIFQLDAWNIRERGFVATRAGLEALREQMHAEALRRRLGQAAGALVIGDGAVWLWRLADDRWPQARQRLDFYHAVQHLVGRALFPRTK